MKCKVIKPFSANGSTVINVGEQDLTDEQYAFGNARGCIYVGEKRKPTKTNVNKAVEPELNK